MSTVTFDQYMEDKVLFARKHNAKSECRSYTTPLVNDCYHQGMYWEDGAEWDEVIDYVTETVEVKVHGIRVQAQVKLQRIEYWTTEFGSKYVYQPA